MKLFGIGIFLLFVLNSTAEGHKILGVFPTPWKSHWNVGASVLKQLARAGHDITFVSPFELREPNVRNVILTNYPDTSKNMFDFASMSPLLSFVILPEALEHFIDFTLSHPNVQGLMNENFDAVIVETFHSEALLGFGSHFKIPVIGVTTFGTSIYSNIMTATPNPTSYIPNVVLDYTDNMSFLQRLHNTVIWILDEIYLRFEHYPKQRALYEKYFPQADRSFDDQRKSVALVLNNNYYLTSTVKPGMPNVIDIGGIHVEPANPLPDDLQEFLDSAKHGAILFSMGSIIQAVQWPPEKREAFVEAFGKLKQKVLWKYENITLPNKPDNVMIRPWIPQRDVLAHRNVNLFITHGGLLGATEALVEGVPILGIPIFGDQKMNMNMAVARGNALQLSFHDISEESLTKVLDNVLHSRVIAVNAKEASRIYTDRPMSPQTAAVYWVEYVIRHQGAHHLRPAGLDLNYFELHSIDVYATLLAIVLAVLSGFKIAMKILFCKHGRTETKTDKQKVN